MLHTQRQYTNQAKKDFLASHLEGLLLDLLIKALEEIRFQNSSEYQSEGECSICENTECPSHEPIPF
jgi:hypothetical protein